MFKHGKKNYDENHGKQFQSPSAFSSEKSEGLRNLFSLLWLITGPPMIIISLSIISASSLLWRPIPVCVFERRHIGHQIVPISYLRLAGNSRWSGYDHAMLKNTMINTISNIINVIRTQFCWKRHGIHHFAFVLHVILCKDRSELFLQDPFIGNVFAMSNAWHFQSIESPHVLITSLGVWMYSVCNALVTRAIAPSAGQVAMKCNQIWREGAQFSGGGNKVNPRNPRPRGYDPLGDGDVLWCWRTPLTS